MIKIGQIVVTKNSGVCKIITEEEMNFGAGIKKYYVLRPVFAKDQSSKVYIPADQNGLLRPLMKKEEILDVIDTMPKMEKIWFNDQKERRSKFDEIYRRGNIYEICQLVKSLYLHNEELKLSKHTLSMLDREYLNKLKEGVYQEFSLALDIPYEEVDNYIEKRISC